MNVFITGVSSGLGKSLMEEYIKTGHSVYGMSRKVVKECNHVSCDLGKLETVETKLEELLDSISNIDVVILNAGMLGEIKLFQEWSLSEISEIMNLNVWSNKIIIDWLLDKKKIKQVVSISSGASEHTYKGWSGYSLSKSALRMMMDVYSKDANNGHFMSVAPGLINTSMQDYLCNKVDRKKFPIIDKFIDAKNNNLIDSSEVIACKLIKLIPQLKEFENGSYIDMRKL
jgi:NAD(P)-dependent dehydrogenase (short-subunit alcohol dehydrogenase family)